MGRHILFALRNIFLFSIALFSLAGCGNDSSRSGPTAETILAQMKQTYANCQTYQDTGVVTTTFIQSSGNWIDEKPFLTAFVRPDRFRFEYKETQSSAEYRYIIWLNGAEVLSWWDVTPGIKTEESLDMAIAGATGVSLYSNRKTSGRTKAVKKGFSSIHLPLDWMKVVVTTPVS